MPLIISQRQTNKSDAQVTSLSASFLSRPLQNRLLVVSANSDATLTITGSGWAQSTLSVNDTGLYQWWKIAGANEGTVITVTPSAAASTEIAIEEWSGNATASPLDKVNNTSTAPTTAAISTNTTPVTAQADEIAIGAVGWNVTGSVISWTNSYVEVAELGGLGGVLTFMAVAELTLTATGAQTTAGTLSPNNNATKSGLICTYKAAVAGVAGSSNASSAGVAGEFHPHLNYRMWL